MSDILERLEDLQADPAPYYIDYLPHMKGPGRPFEIEGVFLKTYLRGFSGKVMRILIRLMETFDHQAWLVDSGSQAQEVTGASIKDISETIIAIVMGDEDRTLHLVLEEEGPSLISLRGGFTLDIYQASDRVLEALGGLVDQEDLFLRQAQKA